MQHATPNKTPLHGTHVSLGAKTVDFGGWDMPLWYPTGAVAEHRAVITNAGIFDTSHMSVLELTGAGAYTVLQTCFTRDLRSCVGPENGPLTPGRCVYGAFLNDEGHVIDDAVVYQIADGHYLCIVNAGMGAVIKEHVEAHSQDLDVRTDDLTGSVGKLDVQGPLAGKIMSKALELPDRAFDGLKYFGFRGMFRTDGPTEPIRLVGGIPILLSRSGYTGEFGFEIVVAADRLTEAWSEIVAAGKEFGLTPCGLAARDSLRAGAVLPLSHQDIGPWPFINHPWPFALPFNEDKTAFTKEFIGAVIISERPTADHTVPFCGYDPRKVPTADPAVVVDENGNEIGVVLTCVADMAIGRVNDRIVSMASPDKPDGFKPKGLVCGFVRVKSIPKLGKQVLLKDNRRTVTVEIVEDVRPDRTARRPLKEMV
jgi:aminomethyltransferase